MNKQVIIYIGGLLLYLLSSYLVVNLLLLIGTRLFFAFKMFVDSKSIDFSSTFTSPTVSEIIMIHFEYVVYYLIAYIFVLFGLYQFWIHLKNKKKKEVV